MPRIITPESNKKLKREYRVRFLIKMMWSLSISIIIVGVFFFPSYALLHYYQTGQTTPDSLKQQEIMKETSREYEALFERTYDLAQKVINDKSPHVKVADLLFSYAPPALVFDAIELQNDQGGAIAITVRGNAPTREDLLALERRIVANPNFSGFEIPIDSLRMQTNIPINISFVYHEK